MLRRRRYTQFPGTCAPRPQDISRVINADLLDTLAGAPGIRLLETTASNRKYRAMDLDVQRFVVPEGGPNTDQAIANAPLHHRQILNKRRGTLT